VPRLESPAPRTVDVAPARLDRWIAGFAERHGDYSVFAASDAMTLTAADGATAAFTPALLPLPGGWAGDRPVKNFTAHALAPRIVGLLLVRLGGYAAGVFEGGRLVASKVGSRQVHGRSAAGGWSQQRFARRREGQARVALGAAADAAAAILLPALPKLDVVVSGGDRPGLRAVLGDVRLLPLGPLVSTRVLDVADPKAQVLRESINAAMAVHVTITDPPGYQGR